jgi:hypothetical protein
LICSCSDAIVSIWSDFAVSTADRHLSHQLPHCHLVPRVATTWTARDDTAVIGEWTALPLALPQPSIIANEAIRLECKTPRQTSSRPHFNADATPRLERDSSITPHANMKQCERIDRVLTLRADLACPCTRCLGRKRGDGAGDERAMSSTSLFLRHELTKVHTYNLLFPSNTLPFHIFTYSSNSNQSSSFTNCSTQSSRYPITSITYTYSLHNVHKPQLLRPWWL